MLLAALTGGIGSGKSEVARRLAALGADIVDADLLAREVVEPGTDGLHQVVEAFGSSVLTPEGGLDREALAQRVFADDEARRMLNGIVHPLVRERALQRVVEAGERNPDAVVIQDIPLLVENGVPAGFQAIIVVDVPPELQVERLTSVRGMPEAAARARMAAQATREQRLAAATVVIDNTGSLDDLDPQVRAVWDDLSARARQ